MFDAAEVDKHEAAARSIAEAVGRSLDKFKVLGESSAMKSIAESQRINNEKLLKFAQSMAAPQISPVSYGSSAAFIKSELSLGEAVTRKAQREKDVAAATIGNYRATATLVEAVIKQGVEIEKMANEIAVQVEEAKQTSHLTRWILVVSAFAACGGIAGLIVSIVS